MSIIDRWRDSRDRARWDRWEREHRWDALARYNQRVGQGIVHTPEYVEAMIKEQAAFDAEMGHAGGGFPIMLDPVP